MNGGAPVEFLRRFRIPARQTWRLAAACLALGIPLWFGNLYWLETSTHVLWLPGLPKAFDGYRIAVLSDMHINALVPEAWLKWQVDHVNRLKPDFIFLIGDYVQARQTRAELDAVWPILSGLRSRDGVAAVNGNHDNWADHAHALAKLEESGWSVRHRARFVSRRSERIAIVGAGDLLTEEIGLGEPLKGIPDGVFRIVLAHNPDTVDLPRTELADLFVSGHTHGGQVVIPVLDLAPLLPVKNRTYGQGLRKTPNGEPIFISRGTGWSIAPVRFWCRPEIPVLTLRRRD